jgi:hypothetical protein
MTHEILHLNSKRAYVLVNDVWYDTHRDLFPKVGESFLIGRIEKVLTYEDYTKKYPESKREMFPGVNDKTTSNGFIRKSSNEADQILVKYAVNPTVSLGTQPDFN